MTLIFIVKLVVMLYVNITFAPNYFDILAFLLTSFKPKSISNDGISFKPNSIS